jgi:hypothetical protein
MVKGTSRRVIVVRSPDPRFFEQAVFFLREEALTREGVSADQVLTEAGNVAACYLHNHPLPSRLRFRLPQSRLLWMMLGALLTGGVWLATVLI